MKPLKKSLKIALIISFCALLFILLVNSFDSSLNRQTSEILNKAANTNGIEEEKCAAMLGLLVDSNLDSLSEGIKLLGKIRNDLHEPTAARDKVLVPYEINKIEPKENCETGCRYSSTEHQRLKEELNKQRIFLTRFEKLMNLKNMQCQTPEVVFRLPLSGYMTLAKNIILEYRLLSKDGRVDEASAGLQKMNRFFEQSLSAEKYSLIFGLINIHILHDVREALVSLKKPHQNAFEFQYLKYEDIAQRIQTGELQLIASLLKKPLDYRLFELSSIAHDKVVTSNFGTLTQSAIDKITNYLFLPNSTSNEMLEGLQSSAWHPCIGQTDISCDMKSSYGITWIRNPVGKSLSKMMTSNMAASFRKIKNKIEALNKFTTRDMQEAHK